MNKLVLRGNLTTDVTLREVNFDGNIRKVADFGFAVNHGYGDLKQTTYFRVHAWRGLADVAKNYLSKGRSALIVGPVVLNKYTDANGDTQASMEVCADEIEFLDAGRRE